MTRVSMGFAVLFCAWAVAQTLVSAPAEAKKLDPKYYDKSCPDVFRIVADLTLKELAKDSRIAASMLRMHFHDCFVQGCDASVLLDGPDGVTEKTAPPNNGSLRRFDFIDTTKAALEKACPNVVSCADVVALTSFFGIVFSGGPTWVIPLGRRDSLAPNLTLVGTDLAPPFADLDLLLRVWARQDFGVKQLVALSGAHTIGDSRCAVLNNVGTQNTNPQLNSARVATIKKLCQNGAPNAIGNLDGMDLSSARSFDNSYFKQFADENELFNSDHALLNSSETRKLVERYAKSQDSFFKDFAASMINMGDLKPLVAPQGEVRKNCHVINSKKSTLRMPGVESLDDYLPRPEPKELTQEEQDEFIAGIKAIVASVTDEYLASHADENPLVLDTLYSSS